MTLTRWSPVSGLAALEIDRLNRMFDVAFRGEPLSSGGWVPLVDIIETAGQELVVKADLPEMNREDIKISFENNVLTIEGERKLAVPENREQHHRVERGYGAFRRSFTMPSFVDGAAIVADYQDGVLTVKLPRRAETRPRQIQIS
ncbi:MAG: Hsp20/alpha crystallin family protein [Acidobacteriota bacterium]